MRVSPPRVTKLVRYKSNPSVKHHSQVFRYVFPRLSWDPIGGTLIGELFRRVPRRGSTSNKSFLGIKTKRDGLVGVPNENAKSWGEWEWWRSYPTKLNQIKCSMRKLNQVVSQWPMFLFKASISRFNHRGGLADSVSTQNLVHKTE